MARILIAAALAALVTTPALAADAGAGSKVFKAQCAICHATTASAAAGIGPSLAGVVGRKAGTQAAYRSYSPAMKAYGKAWSDETLKAYITNPAKVVPGNKMPFAGLKDAGQTDAVVAYLHSLR